MSLPVQIVRIFSRFDRQAKEFEEEKILFNMLMAMEFERDETTEGRREGRRKERKKRRKEEVKRT
jgi:hypothetical protein